MAKHASCLQGMFISLHNFFEKVTPMYHDSASVLTPDSPIHTVTPLQVQQSIEQLVATKIWMSTFM